MAILSIIYNFTSMNTKGSLANYRIKHLFINEG